MSPDVIVLGGRVTTQINTRLFSLGLNAFDKKRECHLTLLSWVVVLQHK
jgi:hypothetical protein